MIARRTADDDTVGCSIRGSVLAAHGLTLGEGAVLRRRFLIPLAVAGSMGVALTPAFADASTATRATGTHLEGKAVANVPASTGAAFKTFSSPASKSVHLQKAALAAIKSAGASTAATAGTTIYATTGAAPCSTDTGNGTQANPYCNVQDAVNAASPGDTIDIGGSTGSFDGAPVTITTSDLTIVGTSAQSWLGEGLTLNGVSNVTISNLMVERGTADVVIENSSGITLDSDFLGGVGGAATGVSIDGSSSNIAVTHTYVDSGTDELSAAISVAAGAKNIQIASDLIGLTPVNRQRRRARSRIP